MVQVDTNSPKERRKLFFLSLLIFEIIWASLHAASRHIALAIPSLLETDPQTLERWVCADEDHLGQIIPSDGFWSRMSA